MRDGVWDVDLLQRFAFFKSVIADMNDGIGNDDLLQGFAAIVFTNHFISITCKLNGRKVITQIL